MYPRIFSRPKDDRKSYFIFGPRGTGKSTWISNELRPDVSIDLLDSTNYMMLLGNPKRLGEFVAVDEPQCIVIDEVQKIPELLDEVHRLIEKNRWKFVLTGSSARKLKKHHANLLAGRALTKVFHPLSIRELGKDFILRDSIKWGHLPAVFAEKDKDAYLKSYVATYLKEEVQSEGIVRNMQSFARFLEISSFSQASILNVSRVAKDAGKDPKVAEEYFQILEDLLIARRLPVFSHRARRKTVKRNKFYFFDAGVFNAIRPQGPLDERSQINGAALETLVYQELRAQNDGFGWGFDIFFWHTVDHHEVDFVLYGKQGLTGIEVTLSNRYSPEDLKSLRQFKAEFPKARTFFLYTGDRRMKFEDTIIMPVEEFLRCPEKEIL